MNKPFEAPLAAAAADDARSRWEREYAESIGTDRRTENVSGIPIRDYRAEVTLTPDGEGTAIRWQSQFRAKIPGTGRLARRRLEQFIEETAEGLARESSPGAG